MAPACRGPPRRFGIGAVSGDARTVGSGGGVSTYYQIPWWQAGVDMTANLGSTTMRNVPDVALTADNVFVDYNNGSSGGFGGTSCAAPLWAGFTALVNQQSVAVQRDDGWFSESGALRHRRRKQLHRLFS